MDIKYKTTLLEYDKIEVFLGCDSNLQLYIGLLVNSDDRKDTYCVVAVRIEDLQEFVGGELELRDLFENRPTKDWYLADVFGSITEPIELVKQKMKHIEDKYLSDAGFYLKKNESLDLDLFKPKDVYAPEIGTSTTEETISDNANSDTKPVEAKKSKLMFLCQMI